MATALVIGVCVWALMDTSEKLTSAQIKDVEAFVNRTRSADVAQKFREAIADGALTVNETRAIIEVAKKAEPGYGFLSDQKNTE